MYTILQQRMMVWPFGCSVTTKVSRRLDPCTRTAFKYSLAWPFNAKSICRPSAEHRKKMGSRCSFELQFILFSIIDEAEMYWCSTSIVLHSTPRPYMAPITSDLLLELIKGLVYGKVSHCRCRYWEEVYSRDKCGIRPRVRVFG